MKRGKISGVEQFYVQANRDKPVSVLAKELDRSESTVQKLLAQLPAVAPSVEPEQEFDQNLVNPTPKEIQENRRIQEKEAHDAISGIYKGVNLREARKRQRIRRDGRNVGVIMTPEVSGKLDDTSAVIKPGVDKQLPKDATHRPMGENN